MGIDKKQSNEQKRLLLFFYPSRGERLLKDMESLMEESKAGGHNNGGEGHVSPHPLKET